MDNSKKTAIARTKPSAPLRRLLEWNQTRSLIPAEGDWLDVGCGRGRDVEYLLDLGYNAHGYDPNSDSAAVREWPEGGRFDVISCIYVWNVIEDLGVVRDLYARMLEVLKPGGKIYIATRTPEEIMESLGMRSRREMWDNSHYEVFQSVRTYGVTTQSGTFQRGWKPHDIRNVAGKSYSSIVSSSKRFSAVLMKP